MIKNKGAVFRFINRRFPFGNKRFPDLAIEQLITAKT